MLKVNGFKFKWQHSDSGTECILVNDELGYQIVGKATLSSTDKFVKEVGRKISLRRALHNLRLDKQQRAEIWNAYRTMTLPARWGN